MIARQGAAKNTRRALGGSTGEVAMAIGSKRGRIAPRIGKAVGAGDLGADATPVLSIDLAFGRFLATVVGGASAYLLALVLWATCAMAQENACATPDPRQACSYQCCGRRSCPPSCEVDCVKLCVEACSSQTRSLAYDNRKRDLQLRCGNKGAR
jgi:hypothetical protein